MKNIIIIGATGSIGTQTLDVISHHPDLFQLVSIAFGKNIKLGIKIIKNFNPHFVSVATKEDAKQLQQQFPNIEFGYGESGLVKAATFNPTNSYKTVVVTAVVGSIGLEPTLEAIKQGYDIALANKETLVTAGHLVLEMIKKYGVQLLPVDSEHSALFQALNGENKKEIKELIITASGGSFRNKTREDLQHVTLKDALNHPNWSMGSKITIDSATMMNKGFEVIEAHYLFDIPYDQISTVLHKESVIHSMIEFVDTSIIAQLGQPDMRIPIQYALTYPNRMVLNDAKRLKLSEITTLHFDKMDFDRFPCLKYAYEAGRIGGSLPTVLNAANEAAVSLFLQEKISFLTIEKIIYEALEQHQVIQNPDLDTILLIDKKIKDLTLTTYSKGALS